MHARTRARVHNERSPQYHGPRAPRGPRPGDRRPPALSCTNARARARAREEPAQGEDWCEHANAHARARAPACGAKQTLPQSSHQRHVRGASSHGSPAVVQDGNAVQEARRTQRAARYLPCEQSHAPARARTRARPAPPPGHLGVTVRERSRRALGQPERRCWGSNTARREGADLVDTAHPAKAHPTGLAWHAGPRACVSAAACSRARVGVTVKKKDEARLKHLKWHRGQPRTHQKRPREARRNWREEGTKSSCPPPAPLALGPLTTSAKTSTPTRSSHATTTTTTTKTHTPRGREAL